jgi:hypothetical protein
MSQRRTEHGPQDSEETQEPVGGIGVPRAASFPRGSQEALPVERSMRQSVRCGARQIPGVLSALGLRPRGHAPSYSLRGWRGRCVCWSRVVSPHGIARTAKGCTEPVERLSRCNTISLLRVPMVRPEVLPTLNIDGLVG